MQQRLLHGIRERMLYWLRGYPSLRELEQTSFITGPGLGAQAGVKGALAMAIAMCQTLRHIERAAST